MWFDTGFVKISERSSEIILELYLGFVYSSVISFITEFSYSFILLTYITILSI